MAPGLPAIWCVKIFQEHFLFPCRDWNRPSLQGVLVTFRGRWYLETEFWVLGVFVLLLLVCPSGSPPSGQNWAVCAYVYVCVHVYTDICVCESTHRHSPECTHSLTHLYPHLPQGVSPVSSCQLLSLVEPSTFQFIDVQNSSLNPRQDTVVLRKRLFGACHVMEGALRADQETWTSGRTQNRTCHRGPLNKFPTVAVFFIRAKG